MRFRSRRSGPCGARLLMVVAIVGALLPTPVWAADRELTRLAAIRWLERNQNGDGSWGVGGRRWVTTAEALLALAKANRPSSIAAQRAKGWLLHHQTPSQDARARAIRALHVAGVNVTALGTALERVGRHANGWGVVACRAEPVSANPCTAITSYDTALALGALKEAGVSLFETDDRKKDFVLDQRRGDQGWSGDQIPPEIDAPSDPTTTAEIVRALFGTASADVDLTLSLNLLSGSGAPVSSATSLELASRLAALHAHDRVDPTIELALLARATASGGVWSVDDALTNALGLLALTTRPGTSFGPVANEPDADGDGVPDSMDLDRDGDGVENLDDLFDDDPTEWADTDGDGTGDDADLDDDGDGVADLSEYEGGTSPWSVDSDGDRFADGADGIVGVARLAEAWDLDGNGFIDGELDVPSDPTDGADHPGRPGDTAPLGHPDAQVGAGDLSVLMRVLRDPGVLDEIPGSDQNRDIAEGALDANQDGRIDAGDALAVSNALAEQP